MRVAEPIRRAAASATRVISIALIATLAAIVALPASAFAEATAGPEPTPGPPGLPDGRVYELVSPANKNGNSVTTERMSVVSADGNAILYIGTGAMGNASGSLYNPFISRRGTGGWLTESATPAQVGDFQELSGSPTELVPSASFTHVLFTSEDSGRYTSAEPAGPAGSVNVFLSETPGREPLWLGEPKTADPVPAPGGMSKQEYAIAGASPELHTVYFATRATMLPSDAARARYVEATSSTADTETKPWGFYEWRGGTLNSAGVLPNGTVSPFGAMPAAYAGLSVFNRTAFFIERTMPAAGDNQVSESGNAAFFVSPDPVASSVTNAKDCEEAPGMCTTEAPQLYVRETMPDGSKRTVLVSRSELPGQEGTPAPTGAIGVENAVEGSEELNGKFNDSYVYASPDGSQAFFATTARLTSAAPSNEAPKEYDFNLATEELTYLPGVDGPIAGVASNGSELLFEEEALTPWQLKLWTAGPGGGSVRPIAALTLTAEQEAEFNSHINESIANLANVHPAAAGSVFVFSTNDEIPGFNDGGGFWQVYRYAVASNELSCVSCPPPNQKPVGNAEASYSNRLEFNGFGNAHSTIDTRVVSADGSRVFFDSPNALLPGASNGLRNVYEWENGTVYLISSGTSGQNAYIMGSSASGNDVFFETAAGLVPADADGAYDVYDARVPRPGDVVPPEALPCEGAVCQGPPSTPQLLSAPASASFSGPGNQTPTSLAAHKKHHHAKSHKKRKQHRGRRGHHRNRRRRRHRRNARHGKRRDHARRRHGRGETARHARNDRRGK